jgi:Zn finger protein HypA/HybF involved in hydrogenase expression
MSKRVKEPHIHYNKSNTEKFIKKSIQIWGNKYDYSKTEYIDSKTKVTIICNEHKEFEQLPSNHYNYGCGSCGHSKNVRNVELKEKCKNNFEIKSNNIHNNVYSYTKSCYVDANTKVTVTCKEHGDYDITPNNHLRGKGCPKCGKELVRISKIKPYKDYYYEFLKLYQDKYDYSLVNWKGSSYPISILCKKHGLFTIVPYLHKLGKECPKCCNRHSKISIEWLSYMEIKYSVKISHAQNTGEHLINNSRYKADGYCKTNNTIFEFHGDFWHGNPKIYNKTKINPRIGVTFGELYDNTIQKANYIKNNGYKLIEIWENDWKQFIKSIKIIQKIWIIKRKNRLTNTDC